ncbi:MAG TPA: branched-chain amino acid ABC transporter substrate-binding protein, partial [Roseovarius nubinhibens]|nr:branched-chain amino acid ABC transporter substrate-binding protein [Roseovarius nubinhibens]
MSDKSNSKMKSQVSSTTRRGALKTLALGAGAASLPMWARYAQASTSEPIKIGFQVHRTGIGAAYGRWYGRTTEAAVKLINEGGGINGRMVEIVAEDDGTDPKRG